MNDALSVCANASTLMFALKGEGEEQKTQRGPLSRLEGRIVTVNYYRL